MTGRERRTSRGLLSAVPAGARTVLLLGGAGKSWSTALEDVKQAIAGLETDAAISDLLGPLGSTGLDLSKPGSLGLVASEGMCVFDAGDAVGLAAMLRSPAKWRASLSKAAKGKIKPLKVQGAKESGRAVLDEDLELFFARKPPFLLCMFGASDRNVAQDYLSSWCSSKQSGSMAKHQDLSSSMESLSLEPDAILWLDLSDLSGGDHGTMPAILEGFFHPRHVVVGLEGEKGKLNIEAFLVAEGRLVNELDRTVSFDQSTRLGFDTLSNRTKAWLTARLDTGLFFRMAPSVAGDAARLISDMRRKFKVGLSKGTVLTLAVTSMHLDESPEHEGGFGVNGFLCIQLLGQELAARAAGLGMDAVGSILGRSKKLLLKDPDRFSSINIAGMELKASWHKGCLILATDKDSLDAATTILDSDSGETIPAGMLGGLGITVSGNDEHEGFLAGFGSLQARLYRRGPGLLLEVSKRK